MKHAGLADPRVTTRWIIGRSKAVISETSISSASAVTTETRRAPCLHACFGDNTVQSTSLSHISGPVSPVSPGEPREPRVSLSVSRARSRSVASVLYLRFASRRRQCFLGALSNSFGIRCFPSANPIDPIAFSVQSDSIGFLHHAKWTLLS